MDDKIGKRYRGDKFSAITTPAAVEAANELQKQYDAPEAITLDVYFVLRGVRNIVMKDTMRSRVTIKRATPAAWDEIFRDF